MSEPAVEVPQSSSLADKVKAALPSVPALAMTAGAGVAGGGLLDQDLTEVLMDLSKWAGAAWIEHPGSWAGVFIFLGGLIFHLKGKGVQS